MAVRRDTLPGSYRGAPAKPGTGSGQGPNQGGHTSAPRQGTRRFGNGGNSGWTPTVVNLVILVIIEIAAYAALRYAFRSAHGG